MKMLAIARIDHEKFNAAVRDGSAGEKTQRIVDATKPEAVYFTEIKGRRTVLMIVDMKKESDLPALAEPWFLTFNAKVEFHPVMLPQDLKAAGLESLGKKWR